VSLKTHTHDIMRLLVFH